MMWVVEKIQRPATNWNDPDSVLAQSVASDSGWLMDDAGRVYDERGVIIAESLSELGTVMRGLGWFVPADAVATGVHWSQVPPAADRAQHVRASLR